MKNHYQLNKEKYKAKAKARYELKKEELKANMRVYSKKYGPKRYKATKLDGFAVYLLPEENYVGVTSNLVSRVATHKNKHKRNVKGATIIKEFSNQIEAYKFEEYLHLNYDYNGYRSGKMLTQLTK